MARVTVYQGGNVRREGTTGAGFRAADYGPGLGQAIETAGRELANVAERRDQIEGIYDEQDASRLDLEHIERARLINGRLREARGADAQAHTQTLSAELEQFNDELLGRARSPRARELLRNSIARRTQTELGQFEAYADEEFVQGFRATSKARLTALADGAASALDNEAVQSNLTEIDAEIARLAQFEGWEGGAGGPQATVARAEMFDQVHGGVLDRMFSAPDPDIDGVLAYLDDYGNQITPKLRSDTMARLQNPLQDRMARGDADVAMGLFEPSEAASSPSATALIESFEGFRESTYWDVNHHRVGYGSDTVTAADGRVREVRQGDRVTREDADRDLSRRVSSVEQTASRRAGQGWGQLPEGARAAVISVAYNYGESSARLQPLWDAARTGNAERVASVIESLAGDNEGTNRTRRLQEANTARGYGGTPYANSAREWDRGTVEQALNDAAEQNGWSPERTQRARAEMERRIDRDEGLLRDQQQQADQAVSDFVQAKGDAFISTSMIPRELWSGLSSADKMEWERTAEANRKATGPIANSETVMGLNLMRFYSPAEFASLNLGQYVGRVTQAELDTLLQQQAKVRTEGQGWSPRSGIVTALTYGSQINGVEHTRDQKAAIMQIMEAEANALYRQNGNKPLTDADYQTLYRSATRTIHTNTTVMGISTGGNDRPRYELTLGMMPGATRTRLTRSFRTQFGRDPNDDELLRLYRVDTR